MLFYLLEITVKKISWWQDILHIFQLQDINNIVSKTFLSKIQLGNIRLQLLCFNWIIYFLWIFASLKTRKLWKWAPSLYWQNFVSKESWKHKHSKLSYRSMRSVLYKTSCSIFFSAISRNQKLYFFTSIFNHPDWHFNWAFINKCDVDVVWAAVTKIPRSCQTDKKNYS